MNSDEPSYREGERRTRGLGCRAGRAQALKLLLDVSGTRGRAAITRTRRDGIKEHLACQALADPDVASLARREHRGVVTNNVRDFRLPHAELVAAAGDGHAGMISHLRRVNLIER